MHSDFRIKPNRVTASKAKVPWSKYAKWSLAVLVLLFLLYIAMIPLRAKGAGKLLDAGDNYLKDRKYISAIVAYRKAEYLKGSGEISARIQIARDSEHDVLKLEPFLREVNDVDGMNQLAAASQVPKSDYEGVVQAKKYIENSRPDLSIIAAETVTEMDGSYTDAWLYLGIANYNMMKSAEISGESRDFYRGKAREALTKAKTLDETNEDVAKYLESVK